MMNKVNRLARISILIFVQTNIQENIGMQESEIVNLNNKQRFCKTFKMHHLVEIYRL